MSAGGGASYFKARRGLMLAAAALWLCFGFVLPVLAGQVPAINVFGVVVGFAAMAAISIVALVAALFWFANRQNALERDEDS
jgi:putative solute:sodium symporter small subunit